VVSLKSPVRQTGLLNKTGTILLALVFLCVTASCSHSPVTPTNQDPRADNSSVNEIQTQTAKSGAEPWWKKPESEWLIATLIVIGIGISIGAAIMISSGAGGLNVRINK